jgi:hypothetical protein
MHNSLAESDTGCDVFGKGKAGMRKKQKMGGRDAIDVLQPVIEGDRNASQRDAIGSENTT